MSLHGNPQCAATAFALHLEQTYGLQLDPYRHRQLVVELEEYAGRVDELPSGAYMMPPAEPAECARGWREDAERHLGNEQYYRGLLVEIGSMFGLPARTADDGSVYEDVICLKVPALVRASLNLTAAPGSDPVESTESYEASEALQETRDAV